MSTTTAHPVVFISYSWSSIEHQEKVLALATELRENAVDVRLDKWDLKEGHDKFAFMESMVNDPAVSKVLIVCDSKYQSKAADRVGGVGTESQIISAEIYGKVGQQKFVPVVFEVDTNGKPCLPTFMAARMYVDMSTDDVYGDGFEQLLRLIYDRPRYPKPELGTPPAFLDPPLDRPVSVKELAAFRRAIQEGKSSADGLESEFLRVLERNLAGLHISDSSDAFDEKIVEAIGQSKPFRDQFDQYVGLKASFAGDDPRAYRRLIKFLEDLANFCEAPEGLSQYNEHWFDASRFLMRETLMLTVSALLREQAWSSLDQVCSESFVASRRGTEAVHSFATLDYHLRSLDDHRNRRLTLRRTSVSMDVLHGRIDPSGTKFQEMMQADLFLSLRSLLHPEDNSSPRDCWFPRSLVYLRNATDLPIFLKAKATRIRSGLRTALGISDGAELSRRFEAAAVREENFKHWRFDYRGINVRALANIEQLTAE